MKRILSVLTILLFGLLLVACKPEEEPEPTPDLDPVNQAPSITGAESFEIVKGTPIDLAEGVTATDPEDGDLTSSIVIDDSLVNVNENGVYKVTYTVKDKEGLEATAVIYVTVFTPNSAPSISGVDKQIIGKGDAFDPLAGVTAKDPEDGDITNKIVVQGTVDATKVGRYQVLYEVEDSEGEKGYASAYILVVEDKDALYNGILNVKFADADVRHTFFAAAEKYLLDNMVGGIPFYVASSFTLLAERVTLPVDAYIPSFGWGTRYADITADDSKVLNVEGKYGEAGKYTYRTWETRTFDTLNYWTYDTSTDSDYQSYIYGGFFRAVLNDAKNGWEWAPDLAEGKPVPFGQSIQTINGKVSSKTWRITLREGLEWAFHEDIDTTGFEYIAINAETYIWSYREALNKNFFRAISGGGDFVSEIEGAEDYSKLSQEVYGGDNVPTEAQLAALDVAWAKVGLKKIDDLTLEFTTKNAKGEFDAYYLLAWPAMQRDLYELLGDKYGTDHLHIASSGEYIMSNFEQSKLTQFIKNDKYPHAEESMWTGYDIIIYDSAEVAFQAFLDGKLESSGVPNARVQEFISDPRLLQTPDATTWRLNVNGLQTVAAQQAEFPGSTYVPEPILGYTSMRKALYHIMDRQDLQDNWVPASGIGTTYFSNAYYVDPESGIPYRQTEQGQAVFDEYLGETWGYNKGLALDYFRDAVAQAIKDGYYVKGTPQNYTEINIELRFMNLTSSDATKVRSDFVKQSFELLVDNSNYVKIVVEVKDTPFPGIYYDYMMTGDFDIAIGGISGSALDAASFLEVFSSDNRGGFTINWGFDSSLPEVPVTWDDDNDPETPDVTWYFSFDALVTALNGKATIVDGDDVPPILQEKVYTNWEDTFITIEDFANPFALPEFEGEGFEIIKSGRRINSIEGFFVILPDTYTLESVKAAFIAAGWEYDEYGLEDGWTNEFAKAGVNNYIFLTWDLVSEAGEDIADYYGITVPVDAEGNPLPGFYIY